MKRFVGWVVLFLGGITCQAKVITEPYKSTSELTIRIEGEITHKTLDEFKKALNELDASKQTLRMNSVVLDSIGGSGSVAKEIGKLIRSRGLNTYLPSDASCASACVERRRIHKVDGYQHDACGCN
jgi:hypothetical protein